MTPEQEKLIADILRQIIQALYRDMGVEWCKDLLGQIDRIKYAGKS